MKTYLTIILILASTTMCMADDVVRLRNGSVIKGTIKEYMITGDSVKIATETGTMNLRLSDVGSMSIKGETLEFAEYKPTAKKKYRWSVEVLTGWNLDGFNVGALTTHGVELNPHLFVGGGTGIIANILDRKNGSMFPIYGEIRTTAGSKKVSFTAGLKAGGGAIFSTRYIEPSYYASLDVGVRFLLSEKLSMSITPYLGSRFYSLFSLGVRLAVGTF